ncbi:MAG: DUF4037 domain-containing protein [Treponemataceae bacterium]
MKRKAKLLADQFVSKISEWESVECVALNEAALPDTLDPYFALILDVYHTGPIPVPDARKTAYGNDVSAFETSALQNKDRFFVGELPMRIEYKAVGKISEILDIADKRIDQLWLIKDSGTYMFYRLQRGQVLFQRSSWIDTVRTRLDSLPHEFWIQMRDAHQSKMEHFLSDLGAALMQGDDFYYLISSAGFIKNACVILFCVNKRFEPSHRAYYRQVQELEILPGDFVGRFESFLRSDPEMTPERKHGIAQLIARSLVSI